MNVELSKHAARMAEDLVERGRFASIEDALEHGLMAIEQLDAEAAAFVEDQTDEWWAQVNILIQEAVDDVEAGRTVEATPEWWDGIKHRGRERLRAKLNQTA
ncbi:MAG: hypothetical protein ACRDG3_02600 [Tepidiformaceae bacterium]